MTRSHSTLWLAGVMMVMLATLAALTPHVNAAAGPPRSVFVSWPDHLPAPGVDVAARRAEDGSWSVEIHAEGFTFSEVCTTATGPQAIGHAHIYRGDEKLAAAYAPRIWLGQLEPGRHRLKIVLRAQDHRALVGPWGLISGEIVIDVADT